MLQRNPKLINAFRPSATSDRKPRKAALSKNSPQNPCKSRVGDGLDSEASQYSDSEGVRPRAGIVTLRQRQQSHARSRRASLCIRSVALLAIMASPFSMENRFIASSGTEADRLHRNLTPTRRKPHRCSRCRPSCCLYYCPRVRSSRTYSARESGTTP